MMKKYFVLFLMMVLLAGTVTTVALPPVIEKCKTCGLPIGRCKYKGKHPAKQESSKPKQETSKPKKESSNRKQETSKSNRISNSQSSTNRSNSESKAERERKQREYDEQQRKAQKEYEAELKAAMQRKEQERAKERALDNLEKNMVWIEGGTFIMGTTSEQGSDGHSDGKPVHEVTLTGFYICKYEVTQELWQAVMGMTFRQHCEKVGATSRYGDGANYPVYYVSWHDCQEFITKLNQLTDKHYRLPTEAEWEYAARGRRSNGYKYAGSNDVASVAWSAYNSSSLTHYVGSKNRNELGLYDMSGNVFEWCADWYGEYVTDSQSNPMGPLMGVNRVIRGGSWYQYSDHCRVSSRTYQPPSYRSPDIGFRLALTLE